MLVSLFCGADVKSNYGAHVRMIFLQPWISYWVKFQIMRSRCQDECEADVKITNLKFVQSVQDNAKPKSSRTRSLCQDNAKPMSKRIWEFCRITVGWVSRVVGVNVKPMSRICTAEVKMIRSRCRDACEADVNTNAKPMSRRQTLAVSCMCRRAWIMEIHIILSSSLS